MQRKIFISTFLVYFAFWFPLSAFQLECQCSHAKKPARPALHQMPANAGCCAEMPEDNAGVEAASCHQPAESAPEEKPCCDKESNPNSTGAGLAAHPEICQNTCLVENVLTSGYLSGQEQNSHKPVNSTAVAEIPRQSMNIAYLKILAFANQNFSPPSSPLFLLNSVFLI